MTDYFRNVKMKELFAICRIIDNSDGDIEYVMAKHELYGSYFNDNIKFLLGLDLVEEVSDKYRINKSLLKKIGKENDIKRKIVENLINNKNVYRSAFYMYLNNYKLENDMYTYKPGNLERVQYSSIRNLLIELDVVLELEERGKYVLNDIYIPFIFVNSDKYSLANHEKDLEHKKIIGYKAEVLILKYEIERISKFPSKNLTVEHVSQENISAGYDIKSWTYDEKLRNYIPRYIEVKAIPSIDSRFYWTRNELKQSEILKGVKLISGVRGIEEGGASC